MTRSLQHLLTCGMLALLAAVPALAGPPSLTPVQRERPNALGPNGGVYPLPDLAVGSFQALGSPKLAPGGSYFSLPVRFKVKNQGSRPAGSFKVSVHYYVVGPGAKLQSVRFTTATPGQKPSWYAWSGPLEVGEEFAQRGTVSLPRKLAGRNIRLQLWVDSTASEEFARKSGRVAESNEKNNLDGPQIRLRMPMLGPDNTTVLQRR